MLFSTRSISPMTCAARLAEPAAIRPRLVGFEDSLYFSRQFHKHIGHSPSAIRNFKN